MFFLLVNKGNIFLGPQLLSAHKGMSAEYFVWLRRNPLTLRKLAAIPVGIYFPLTFWPNLQTTVIVILVKMLFNL